jgi:hypothetical protein
MAGVRGRSGKLSLKVQQIQLASKVLHFQAHVPTKWVFWWGAGAARGSVRDAAGWVDRVQMDPGQMITAARGQGLKEEQHDLLSVFCLFVCVYHALH